MTKQNWEIKSERIREQFEELKKSSPARCAPRLNLSWSNWGFGVEPLQASAQRLARAGLKYIELHGNHYAPDLGYDVDEVLQMLEDHGLRVSGVCGIFSPDNDLSSNRPSQRQAAINYIRREVPFARAVGGYYLIVGPGAGGRPVPYDDMEVFRSAQTLRCVADLFVENGVKAAVEPIRSAEVSIIHTISEAKEYLALVDHPGVAHVNGDVYHMQTEESHIGEAVREAGEQLANLHIADSNRSAPGDGCLDMDTVIRALYLLGHNQEGKFVTFEPIGHGRDPLPAMHGVPDPAMLDQLVCRSVAYFRDREQAVLSA